MVPDGQKVWTDGRNGQTDDAKTISLRLHWGIIKDEVPIEKRSNYYSMKDEVPNEK